MQCEAQRTYGEKVKPEQLYTQRIGLLDTKQFGKLQKLLERLNEAERMEILHNQLRLELEAQKEKAQQA